MAVLPRMIAQWPMSCVSRQPSSLVTALWERRLLAEQIPHVSPCEWEAEVHARLKSDHLRLWVGIPERTRHFAPHSLKLSPTPSFWPDRS